MRASKVEAVGRFCPCPSPCRSCVGELLSHERSTCRRLHRIKEGRLSTRSCSAEMIRFTLVKVSAFAHLIHSMSLAEHSSLLGYCPFQWEPFLTNPSHLSAVRGNQNKNWAHASPNMPLFYAVTIIVCVPRQVEHVS